jgi:hypothetical protein
MLGIWAWLTVGYSGQLALRGRASFLYTCLPIAGAAFAVRALVRKLVEPSPQPALSADFAFEFVGRGLRNHAATLTADGCVVNTPMLQFQQGAPARVA